MIQGYKAMMLSAEKSGFTDLDEGEKKEKTEKAATPAADEAADLDETKTAEGI